MQNGISLQQVVGKALVMGCVRHVMLPDIRNKNINVYLDHGGKNLIFIKKDKKNQGVQEESRAKSEKKTQNIPKFSEYLNNCTQVWLKMEPTNGNF